MILKPTHGRIVVEEVEYKASATILLVSDKKMEKFARGVVLEAAEGFYTATGSWIPATVKKGDYVWFNKFNVAELKLGTKTYLVMAESEALVVETEETVK